MELAAYRQEVLKKVEAQVDACREHLVEWFKDEDETPTDAELDVLSWYVVAHMLNNDMWHEHGNWSGVLADYRRDGDTALLREVKSSDGSYWTS